jgi:phosphoserine phosphatase
MLLADMDSTMIQQECIDELADMAGVGERVKDITARAMNGELDFDAALRERVGLLQGLPVSIIDQVLAERITYMPGGETLLRTMKAQGGYAALVSGGFTAFTSQVAAHLGFDENHANTLLSDGDTCLVRWVRRFWANRPRSISWKTLPQNWASRKPM